MSATMVMQRGRVQLEQSDMRIPSNLSKMAKWWFLYAAIAKMQHLMKNPFAKV
jgi:hypothetical protein